MKTINITPFLLALSLLVSCSSDSDDGPEVVVPQDATLTMAIAPGSILTKAAKSETPETKNGEKKINNICAALFKADGSLLTTAYVDYKDIPTETTPDTIRISAKSDTPYTYVILVNVGNQSFSNLDDLKSKTYDLENIKVDNQPMCSRFMTIKEDMLKPGANYWGPDKAFPNKPTGAGSLSEEAVNVYRTASRIDLEQISVSWSGDNAADLKEAKARFHLKRIYVIDAKNATCLADHLSTDASVELTGEERTFLHGREAGENYFSGLDLFSATGENPVVIGANDSYVPANKWQCYVTENTETSNPTTLILKGDILEGDTPILSDRYFFIRLENMKGTDANNTEHLLAGVIRNYVIRISATITGKGSGDEEYKENAYVRVTVTPEEWSVETQHEDVN